MAVDNDIRPLFKRQLERFPLYLECEAVVEDGDVLSSEIRVEGR